MLTVGSPAPDFSIPDQDGTLHSLSEHAGEWVLLYFYPKDDTPGCTKEACGLRDSMSQLKKAGVRIFGVSKDSVASHKKFADKYGLPFPLLADPEKTVIQAYGAWGEKKYMGKTYDGILRISYLIDPHGKIAKAYPTVSPEDHAEEILRDQKMLAA